MTFAGWTRLAQDATILSVAASTYIAVLLRMCPRLFLRHYPEAVRKVAPPTTPDEKRLGRLAGAPFLVLLVGWPIWSALQFVAREPGASTLSVGLYAGAVSMAFNLVDCLILDLLWLGMLRPDWAMIPGVEEEAYRLNWRDHLRGFASGSILALVTGVLAAAARYL